MPDADPTARNSPDTTGDLPPLLDLAAEALKVHARRHETPPPTGAAAVAWRLGLIEASQENTEKAIGLVRERLVGIETRNGIADKLADDRHEQMIGTQQEGQRQMFRLVMAMMFVNALAFVVLAGIFGVKLRITDGKREITSQDPTPAASSLDLDDTPDAEAALRASGDPPADAVADGPLDTLPMP